jgi:putative ABC transport system permease protein
LGALGLLLGSVGLAVVIVRNLLERRGELAVLLAAGFGKRQLMRLVLFEHVLLLIAGLAAGGIAAAVAVLPALMARQQIGWASLGFAIAIVLLNGAVWAWLATRSAFRANLVETLKVEI